MKKKYVITLVIVGCLIGVLALSYAYFTSRVGNQGNAGGSVTINTVEFGDVGFVIEGLLEFKDLDIYPGHKNISSIKVTANGQNRIAEYNLVWEGINTLRTPLKYYVYKTSSKEEPSITCLKKEEGNSVSKIYYEECVNNNFENLGEVVASGEIGATNSSKEFKLVENEVIKGTPEGTTTYYYVVLEYPNLDTSQNIDMGGSFKGEVTVKKISDKDVLADFTVKSIHVKETINSEYIESKAIPNRYEYKLNEEKSNCTMGTVPSWDKGSLVLSNINSKTECNLYFEPITTAKDTILLDKQISQRVDGLSYTFDDDTTGTLFTTEDNDGISYYYAGAPTDNWLKFAGFYWRIIRINGNGSVRLLYYGKTDVIDNASNKNEILSNGYEDNITQYTIISTSTFNPQKDNAYVGYMYGQTNGTYATTHTNTHNSYAKNTLDSWFVANLLDYQNYLDGNAGFCGDRDATSSSAGYAQVKTSYAFYGTRYSPGKPSLKCNNINRDLYTTNSSIIGNKALNYPVGLINGDEILFSGGIYWGESKKIYFYNNINFWTITPYAYGNNGVDNTTAFMMTAGGQNRNLFAHATYEKAAFRPVINLRSDITLAGTGTSIDPYVVKGGAE